MSRIVISDEEIIIQHCLLLMDMVFKKRVRREVKFRKKLKLWRLRESRVKKEFAEGFNKIWDCKEDWCGLARKLLDVASEECGNAKDKPRHFERGGRIKIWMRRCVERESYLGFGTKSK